MSGGFGLPRIDFTPLSQLGAQFAQNARSRDIGTALQAGDYTTAAKVAFDAGDPDTGLNLMKLGEAYKTRQLQQAESAAFSAGLGGAFGGQAGAAPQAAAPRTAGPSFASADGPMGDYLATTRAKESGGNPNARNPNSTATGIDQFTAGTWAGLARKYPQLGLTPDGRTDPKQSTRAMEAFTADNAKALTAAGIPINPGNLYVSHFLGEAGGPKFIAGAMRNPDAPATAFVSPDAARANRTIFFNRDGSPKSAGEVYAERTSRFGSGSPVQQAAAPTADMPAPDAQPAQFQIPPGSTVANRPVEAISQSPLGQRIPFLLRAAGNPNLPEPQRDLAKLLLKQGLDESKLPDEQKDYLLARSQGFGGTFLEYKKELRGGESGFTLTPGQQRYDAQGRLIAGAPDRDKAAENEAKLRAEFTKNLGSFSDVQDAYRRVIASTEQRQADPNNVSAAADMSLIFGFMKMLDPGSVVREGEFATAQNAAGIPDRVRNAYNKALDGEFLQPAQRQAFVDQAQRLYGQARQSAEGTATRYTDLAKRQGLDPSAVVQLPAAPTVPRVGPPRSSGATQQGGSGIQEGATATNPQTGEKITFRGGQWVPVSPAPNAGGPIL